MRVRGTGGQAVLGRICSRDQAILGSVSRHIGERLSQHRENLRLWQNGWLTPTEPCEEERRAVMRELKAAISELEQVNALMGWAKGDNQ